MIFELLIENKKNYQHCLVPRQPLLHTYYVSGIYPELWKQNGLSCISKERIHCNLVSHKAIHCLKHTTSIAEPCTQSEAHVVWLIHRTHSSLIKSNNFHWPHLYTLSWHLACVCGTNAMPWLLPVVCPAPDKTPATAAPYSLRTALRKARFSMQYFNGFCGNVFSVCGCWHQSRTFSFSFRQPGTPPPPIHHLDQ